MRSEVSNSREIKRTVCDEAEGAGRKSGGATLGLAMSLQARCKSQGTLLLGTGNGGPSALLIPRHAVWTAKYCL